MQVNHVAGGVGYTPLNKPIAQIAKEIQGRGLLMEPDLRKYPVEKKNEKNYCVHHNMGGHSAECCKDMREHVENLTQNGYLNEYIDRGTMAAQQRQWHIQTYTIVGGMTLAEDSNWSRKNYCRIR